MMKEIKELEEINPQQRDGLINLTKESLESFKFCRIVLKRFRIMN